MTNHGAGSTWATLEASCRRSPERFATSTLNVLPEPAQRFLTAAVPDGAPLHNAVELEMQGRIKLGPWLRFTARQLLVAGAGFVWAPTVGPRLLRIVGADTLGPDGGRLDFRLYGRIPVAVGTGADVDRSAAGRLAAETVAWLPQALTPQAGAGWQPIDDHRATVTLPGPDGPTDVDITVDERGNLIGIELQRWNDRTKPPSYTAFGGFVTACLDQAGTRIAGSGTVGWDHTRRADGNAFFEYTVTRARFLPSSTG